MEEAGGWHRLAASATRLATRSAHMSAARAWAGWSARGSALHTRKRIRHCCSQSPPCVYVHFKTLYVIRKSVSPSRNICVVSIYMCLCTAPAARHCLAGATARASATHLPSGCWKRFECLGEYRTTYVQPSSLKTSTARDPLGYPLGTARAPLEYRLSTARVPLEYRESTPWVPLECP